MRACAWLFCTVYCYHLRAQQLLFRRCLCVCLSALKLRILIRNWCKYFKRWKELRHLCVRGMDSSRRFVLQRTEWLHGTWRMTASLQIPPAADDFDRLTSSDATSSHDVRSLADRSFTVAKRRLGTTCSFFAYVILNLNLPCWSSHGCWRRTCLQGPRRLLLLLDCHVLTYLLIILSFNLFIRPPDYVGRP